MLQLKGLRKIQHVSLLGKRFHEENQEGKLHLQIPASLK